MSRVAVLGPGRVGTLLTTALARAGHRVVAVSGGSPAARRRVAGIVAGVRTPEQPADACARAELVVLAVPDDAIEPLVTELVVADALGPRHRVVHVSGAHGTAALSRAALAGAGTAACHPATSVPLGSTDPELLVGVAWAVTARPADLAWARQLVMDLGGDPHDLPDDRRPLYHAGLTVGANAVGAALATARQLLLAARVERPAAFLGPLARTSADNVLARGAEALTGPIARGDVGTVAGHLGAIEADLPALAPAYRHLAAATLAPLRASLPDDVVVALDTLLWPGGAPGCAEE